MRQDGRQHPATLARCVMTREMPGRKAEGRRVGTALLATSVNKTSSEPIQRPSTATHPDSNKHELSPTLSVAGTAANHPAPPRPVMWSLAWASAGPMPGGSPVTYRGDGHQGRGAGCYRPGSGGCHSCTVTVLSRCTRWPAGGAWPATRPSTGIGCAVSRTGFSFRPALPVTSRHAW
jgi:hypothetical protein